MYFSEYIEQQYELNELHYKQTKDNITEYRKCGINKINAIKNFAKLLDIDDAVVRFKQYLFCSPVLYLELEDRTIEDILKVVKDNNISHLFTDYNNRFSFIFNNEIIVVSKSDFNIVMLECKIQKFL